MDERVARALAAGYHRIFTKEDGGYSAFVLELPGVNGGGTTIAEANADLDKAIESWVELEIERAHDIPEPLDVDSYSGRTQLRIPPTLHYRAQLRADLEGVSLNRVLSDAVSRYMGDVSSHAGAALPGHTSERLPGAEGSGARRAG